MERIFDNYKGIIVFYIFIIMCTVVLSWRVKEIDSEANNEVVKYTESRYA